MGLLWAKFDGELCAVSCVPPQPSLFSVWNEAPGETNSLKDRGPQTRKGQGVEARLWCESFGTAALGFEPPFMIMVSCLGSPLSQGLKTRIRGQVY